MASLMFGCEKCFLKGFQIMLSWKQHLVIAVTDSSKHTPQARTDNSIPVSRPLLNTIHTCSVCVCVALKSTK